MFLVYNQAGCHKRDFLTVYTSSLNISSYFPSTLGSLYTDTEVSQYPHKAGGLDIHTTDIETLTPSTDIDEISVLLGLCISTRFRYRYKGRGLGIGIVRIKLVR